MHYVKTNRSSGRRSKRSRGRRRAFAAIATIVAAAGIGTATMRGLHRNAPLAPAAVLTAMRPSPAPAPWSPSEIARMRSALAASFSPALQGTRNYSLAIVDARGHVLFDDLGSHAVTPASVLKLIVADTSLDALGPAYRFHTILAAPKPFSGDGRLDGNLWVVGSGDPSLRSDDLRSGIAALERQGLRGIEGRVAVDPSAMHGPELNAQWDAVDANEDFQTATSAVSIDEDTAEFRIYGQAPGTPARAAVVPHSDSLQTSGSVTTSSGSDNVVIAAMQKTNAFRLSGTIPAYTEEKFWLPVHDIPHYVGSVVDAMLRARRITVRFPPAVLPAPLDSIVVWDHRSAPLANLERFMLYSSDNHYAEQLLRAIGRDAGDGDDSRAGIAAEMRFLNARGIPAPGMRLVDGSGLAESNRIAAVTLARVLSDAQLRGGGTELDPLLPQGGKDGTLKHYPFTSARGRVRAKTGHLSDAASLAGYVDTAHHGRLAFAFMVNGSPGDPDSAYVRAVDRLAEF